LSDRKQQFAAKVNELIRQSRSLTPLARKQIVDLLEEAKKRILGEIATLDPKSFTVAQRTVIKNQIDTILGQFRAKATVKVNALQEDAAKNGIAIVDAPLATAGVEYSLGRISQSTLAIAQGYTADLITGLSTQAAAQVNAALARAFLGGQNISDIIAQVAKALGESSPIADRAITVANNEILRMQSIATQARMEDLAGRNPGLKKQWMHINAARVPRVSHIIADGQVQDVDKPFTVEGEDLMYPRDPNGSPGNTINCHCLTRPYLSDEALKSTDFHKGILDSLGISVNVS
jgi:uncharacterized protein with gpF-like domain